MTHTENPRTLLTVLWTFVVLNFFARDIHELGRPGILEQMMSGTFDGVQITEALMLLGGVMIEIPILMTVLALLLLTCDPYLPPSSVRIRSSADRYGRSALRKRPKRRDRPLMGCTGCFTQQVRLCLFHLQMRRSRMAKNEIANLKSVGIDIGKDTFHLVGFDDDGELVLRKKIKRLALNQTFEDLPRCIVGMEACLSAHFVSRALRGMGFEPRIIPAIYVKPFVKRQKNDYNDAEAIAEAALRPNLPMVSEKSQDQLDLQALHRVRSRLVSRRTATINQIRAFLIEQGITVRAGLRSLKNSFDVFSGNQDEKSATIKVRMLSGRNEGRA